MFGTLRSVTKDGTSSLVSHMKPCNPAEGQEKHLACIRCRSKKLKCSGQKSGCSRCRASFSTCSYFDPASGSASKTRKRSSSKAKDQAIDGSTPNESQEVLRAGAQPANEGGNTAPDHESTDGQRGGGSGSSAITRGSDNEDYHQYVTDFIVDGSDFDTGEEFDTAMSHPLDDVQDSIPSEQLPSRHMPQWSTEQDMDDMDYSHLVNGVFSPNESLQIRSEDLQTMQLGPLDDMDTGFAQGMSARNFRGPFSNLAPNINSNYLRQVQQTSDRMQRNPSWLARRKSQPPARQPASVPSQQSSLSQSNTSSNIPQHRTASIQNRTRATLLRASSSRSVNMSDGGLAEVSQRPCACLQTTAAILEDVEVRTFSEDATSLDAMMNFHQETLGELDNALSCSSCTGRSEVMMLLAMAMEKLVSFMEKACARYRQESNSIDAGHSILDSARAASTSGSSSSSSRDARTRDGSLSSSSSLLLSPTSCLSSATYPPSCGSYKVWNEKDWACLVNVLLCLQLRTLSRTLKRMRCMPLMARRESHLAILSQCDNRVRTLGRNISSNT